MRKGHCRFAASRRLSETHTRTGFVPRAFVGSHQVRGSSEDQELAFVHHHHYPGWLVSWVLSASASWSPWRTHINLAVAVQHVEDDRTVNHSCGALSSRSSSFCIVLLCAALGTDAVIMCRSSWFSDKNLDRRTSVYLVRRREKLTGGF